MRRAQLQRGLAFDPGQPRVLRFLRIGGEDWDGPDRANIECDLPLCLVIPRLQPNPLLGCTFSVTLFPPIQLSKICCHSSDRISRHPYALGLQVPYLLVSTPSSSDPVADR